MSNEPKTHETTAVKPKKWVVTVLVNADGSGLTHSEVQRSTQAKLYALGLPVMKWRWGQANAHAWDVEVHEVDLTALALSGIAVVYNRTIDNLRTAMNKLTPEDIKALELEWVLDEIEQWQNRGHC